MKGLMPLITAGGNVYRAQFVGYFDEEGPASRLEMVIDATQRRPVVRRRRELRDRAPVTPGKPSDACSSEDLITIVPAIHACYNETVVSSSQQRGPF